MLRGLDLSLDLGDVVHEDQSHWIELVEIDRAPPASVRKALLTILSAISHSRNKLEQTKMDLSPTHDASHSSSIARSGSSSQWDTTSSVYIPETTQRPSRIGSTSDCGSEREEAISIRRWLRRVAKHGRYAQPSLTEMDFLAALQGFTPDTDMVAVTSPRATSTVTATTQHQAYPASSFPVTHIDKIPPQATTETPACTLTRVFPLDGQTVACASSSDGTALARAILSDDLHEVQRARVVSAASTLQRYLGLDLEMNKSSCTNSHENIDTLTMEQRSAAAHKVWRGWWIP